LKKYDLILFDLDHTLWDYETNSKETLIEFFEHYKLKDKGVEVANFLETFSKINTALWNLYDRGQLHRDVIRFHRFEKILIELGVDDYEMSLKLSADYIEHSPKKPNLIDGAKEILDYLHPKYPMVIVTNGFDDVQGTKLSSSGITHYFKSVVTSARAGHKKPAREIFEFALTENGVAAHQAIMIGDNLQTDIAGAINANIDTVHYDLNGHMDSNASHKITHLNQLKKIL
jgi:YjjG family noncanonical pyrimidine nucleotidase